MQQAIPAATCSVRQWGLGKRAMKKEPFLNAPPSILIFAGLLLSLHLLRQFGAEELNAWLLLNFAFIPALFSYPIIQNYPLWEIRPWSVFTYALLHGSWSHVIMNTLWLLAFGSPVAQRFGAKRFFLFCLLAAPAGAFAHFIAYSHEGLPLVGASGVVSALTAAALRFAFEANGPLYNRNDPRAVFHPAPSLGENFKNPQAMFFVVTWFVINFIFGTGASLLGPGTQIAWQAHIGGFFAGLLLFSLLDPVKKYPS
jgi:membrane associated rhomboid family serine protease